jgi:FAD/FMN-containing dehydrogenase
MIEPFAQGAHVNFLAAEDTARTRSAFGPDSWARLVRVKQEWDPQNLFRVNHNIPPAG